MQELSETDSGYAYRLSLGERAVDAGFEDHGRQRMAECQRHPAALFRPVEGRGAQQQVAVIRHGVGNGIGDARSACPA